MKKIERNFRKKSVWISAIAPSMLFCALALQLCIRLEIIKSGYQVQYLKKTQNEQVSRLRQLRFQHATMTSAGNISKEAKTKLALTSVMPQQLRKVQVVDLFRPKYAKVDLIGGEKSGA